MLDTSGPKVLTNMMDIECSAQYHSGCMVNWIHYTNITTLSGSLVTSGCSVKGRQVVLNALHLAVVDGIFIDFDEIIACTCTLCCSISGGLRSQMTYHLTFWMVSFCLQFVGGIETEIHVWR